MSGLSILYYDLISNNSANWMCMYYSEHTGKCTILNILKPGN